jgi:hypothetical protein
MIYGKSEQQVEIWGTSRAPSLGEGLEGLAVALNPDGTGLGLPAFQTRGYDWRAGEMSA